MSMKDSGGRKANMFVSARPRVRKSNLPFELEVEIQPVPHVKGAMFYFEFSIILSSFTMK